MIKMYLTVTINVRLQMMSDNAPMRFARSGASVNVDENT
jgi:hypothetical protein